LASLALIVAALAPADAASLGEARIAPGTESRRNDSAPATAPSIASPSLTTAAERAYGNPAATVQPPNPAADTLRFVELINQSRKAHGLAPLSTRKDLRTVAARWSARMAAKEKIWHNRDLRYQTSGWWRLGENVGWAAGSVEYLHQAFLASPEHRRNILDPLFTSVGVAETVSADGRIFVVEDFGRFSPL
jgi:uncharacterized protein YkwD